MSKSTPITKVLLSRIIISARITKELMGGPKIWRAIASLKIFLDWAPQRVPQYAQNLFISQIGHEQLHLSTIKLECSGAVDHSS